MKPVKIVYDQKIIILLDNIECKFYKWWNRWKFISQLELNVVAESNSPTIYLNFETRWDEKGF